MNSPFISVGSHKTDCMEYYVELPDSQDKQLVRSKPRLRTPKRVTDIDLSPLNHLFAPIVKGAVDAYGHHLETLVPAIVNASKRVFRKKTKSPTFTTPKPAVVYRASGEKVNDKYLAYDRLLPRTSGPPLPYSPEIDNFKYIETVPNRQYTMSSRGKKALANVTVKAPVARSKRLAIANKPRYRSGSKGVVIRHKELIGPLLSNPITLTYQSNSFIINPGNFGMFQWLGSFASNFDKYRILSFKAMFVSNQPTSTAGRVGLGIDYDSTDPLPADRSEFFSLTHNVESSPWDSLVLNVPFKPEIKFINSHTTTDSKLIDYGQLVCMADQIVTTGTAITLGDIIVEYEVELLEPQQAVYVTSYYSGGNIGAFTGLSVTGPTIAKMVPTTSTTVLEFTLPDGTYLVTAALYDGAAGSPGLAMAIHGGVGTHTYSSDSTSKSLIGRFKISSNDGSIRFTFSSVTIANLESILLSFTRISASNYGASASYQTVIGTY